MTNDINDVMDTLDAAVFSGDTFLDKDNLENFKHYIERWNNQLKVLESTTNQLSVKDSFISAVQGNFSILKVDNVDSTFWNVESCEEEDEDDYDQQNSSNEDDYILTFGFENYDINFKESNILDIEDLDNNSWNVTFSEDGRETTSIFKFYS